MKEKFNQIEDENQISGFIKKVEEALERENLESRKNKSRTFYTREFDEENLKNYEDDICSNEPSLYETFEYTRNCNGVGLAVGFDQIFEYAVNSNLEELFIIDISENTYLSTRAILEIGRRHKELFEKYPSTSEYINYFHKDSIETTLKVLENHFNKYEIDQLQKFLKQDISSEYTDNNHGEAPSEIYHNFLYKNKQKDFNSWLSSDKNLHKILNMYENNKITVVAGDITGEDSIRKIGLHLLQNDKRISLIYFSNAANFNKTEKDTLPPIDKNLLLLPTTENTILINSFLGSTSELTIPTLIKDDPYLSKTNLKWWYVIQTMDDHNKELQGRYFTKLKDGKIKINYNISERIEGTREPKPGIILGGL